MTHQFMAVKSNVQWRCYFSTYQKLISSLKRMLKNVNARIDADHGQATNGFGQKI